MKQKIVLFGCGKGGQNSFRFLSKKYHIVAFTDNNSILHGQKFNETIVIPPQELITHEYDFVFIASMYAGEITRQLIDMGIAVEKIKYLDGNIVNGTVVSTFSKVMTNILFVLLLMMSVYILSELLNYFVQKRVL